MKLRQTNIYRPKLIFHRKVLSCQIGKRGTALSFKKKEGDLKTPLGKWELGKIFIRRDKVKYIRLNKNIKKKINYINKSYFWCDDRYNKNYNKLFINKKNHKSKIIKGYESLYRGDEAYDIIVEIKYNQRPIIRNKGSAIFLHCSFSNLRSTAGCIAVEKKDLKFLINNLQKRNYIYIDI